MELLTEIVKDYPIRLAKHRLQFCRVYPISELDEVILELLNLHEGYLEFKELGELLGFAVSDLPLKNIHYDKAEVSILEELLETLQRYHLITVAPAANDPRKIECTHWGSQALINKEKRLFFEGTVTLPEHYLIKITEDQNAQFPFKKYGVIAIITNSKECDPFELADSTSEDDTLMLLAKNNLDDNPIQDASVELSRIEPDVLAYNPKSLIVTVSLYDDNGYHKIKTGIDGNSSPELDSLISRTTNHDIYNGWLIEARYQYYLDSSMQLSSEGLEEFSSVIDWPKVLNDDRIIWNSKLLELLSDEEIASSQIWTIISENAPHELITGNITKYRNLWNWFRLTERLPFSFILDHANDFDWDFDAFVSKVGSNDIQDLLEKLDDNGRISDWSLVTEKVSFEFLTENLRKYPWDLHLVTKESNSAAVQLILENFDLDWDWSFIAGNWPAHIIIDNYEKLWDRLNLRSFLIRLLRDANELETLMSSNHHIELLNKTLSGSGITFSTTDDIILNETTLVFLDDNNLLFWGEGNISGIEANPNLLWDEPIFQEYHHKVKSEKGFTSVSASIPSFEIIEANPDFPWDFTVISKRKDLDWNIEFIETYKESLPPQNLLTHVSASLVSDNIQFFINWLSQLEELDVLGEFISQHFSFSQIQIWAERLITHEVSVNWGSVLRSYSEEMLADVAIELYERTVALPFLDDLYSFLARKCSLDFILENPDLSWDWKYLTENRLDESQLSNEDFRFKYAEQLYWPYILRNIVSVEDLSDIDALTRFAAAISKAPNEIIKESWEVITGKIRRHKLWEYIPATEKFEVFHWDWDLISSMENLAITHGFLNRYADKLNWNLLSKNPYLNKFFRYDNAAYQHTGQWIDRCREYLYAFQNEWDFSALSHIENLTWNVSIISEFEEKWDWRVLSSTGNLLTFKNQKTGKIEYQTARLRRFSENINWQILSGRHEVTITTDLLSQFAEKGWDWSALSVHPKFEITHKFLKDHAEKAWDYKALTDHPRIKLDKELLLELPEKDWDFKKLSNKSWIDNDLILRFEEREWNWSLLSGNRSLLPDLNLLKVFEGKDDINWKSVVENPDLHITLDTVKILDRQPDFNGTCWNILSIHQKLDFDQHPELLYNYRSSWNWQSLVESHKFNFNNLELLRKYEIYLDWHHLSRQEHFQPTTDVLFQFKDKLDWGAITEKVELSSTLLDQFKDYLHWSYISKSDAIKFTPELIEQFKPKWDYYELKKNVALSYESRSKVSEIIQDLPELEFYFKLKEQNSKWSGYIYHFSHIENALKIIASQRIYSRKSAMNTVDSASTVVHRRDTSHDYARFYFRPQTPTQYYNECLGADIDLRNFDQAQKLGLPKCPIPVFFKFNLQEVLLNMRDQCFVSNGNMQTNWAKEKPISQMMSSFTFKDLYSTIFDTSDNDWRTYIRYSQQEFLVKDQFDFSNLWDVQIIVRSNEDRDQLKALLMQDELAHKIIVDNPSLDIFHYGNKKIEYSFKDGILTVNTDYKGDGIHHGEIHLDFFSETHYDIINGQVKNIQDNRIVAYPNLTVKIPEDTPFKLSFHDDRKNESWLIFDNNSTPKESQKSVFWNTELVNKWQALDFLWKKNIYLNYLLSRESPKTRRSEFLNASTGIDELASVLINLPHESDRSWDTHVQKLNDELKARFSKLQYQDIYNLFEISEIYLQGISNLEPLNYFGNIRLIFMDHCEIKNIDIVQRLPEMFFYESPDYPTNTPSLYHDRQTFPSALNIVGDPLEFVTEYFDSIDRASQEENKPAIKEKLPVNLIDFIENFPEYSDTYHTRVRHYTLFEHTKIVCRQFDKYFQPTFTEVDTNLFKFFLIVHDIGKPAAFKNGNKRHQHEYTLEVLRSIWPKTPFSSTDLALVKALASGDPIGEFMQGNQDINDVMNYLIDHSTKAGTSVEKLFRLFMIYYQCDTAAYTADAGGRKFLEHLFEYDGNMKKFDHDEGLLKFSESYGKKYKKLKERIIHVHRV